MCILLFVREKFLKLFMAAFWLLWTGIVIPAHTRGMIPVVTPDSLARGPAVTCPMCSLLERSSDGKTGDRGLPIDKSKNCAICDMASHLSIAPAIVLLMPNVGVLAWALMRDGTAVVYGVEPGLPVGSRAPPGAAEFTS